MTTGLAIFFFGWASAIAEIIALFKGRDAADEFMGNVVNTYGVFFKNCFKKFWAEKT